MPPIDKNKAPPAAPPINCKLLLIGNSSVGKSSLLLRFSDEQWLPEDESSATIGVDFRVHKMDVKGKKVKLSIWDTAGQERFRTITSSYYRGAQGIILVYDVSSRESFEALPRWFSELETYVSSSVVKIVVGNKVDKEYSRQVPTAEGRQFATRMNCVFLEASAKTARGVREAFTAVVERILETPELWEGPASASSGKGAKRVDAGAAKPGQSQGGSGAGGDMPGSIDLAQTDSAGEGGGCAC
jgi:Ras-related protein Rab-18